ncbi:MAG: DUF5615 family PIN-like protein [Pyrinomonadaceae bacterium]
MNLLLDECVDQRFGKELIGHLVMTVPQMGWAGINNGHLLSLAEQQFDTFITVDRNLSFQQTVSKFKIAVIVLHASTNRLVDLKPLVPQILELLPKIKAGKLMIVST